jgi:hypothetical protein
MQGYTHATDLYTGIRIQPFLPPLVQDLGSNWQI